MRKIPLGTIPCPSTEIVGDPEVRVLGAGIVLSFVYEDEAGERFTSGLQFAGVRAFRKRAESLCTAWHIEDAYDTLVEVYDSSWVRELLVDAQPASRNRFPLRHFMIYLDSFGSFEVGGAEATLLRAETKNDG